MKYRRICFANSHYKLKRSASSYPKFSKSEIVCRQLAKIRLYSVYWYTSRLSLTFKNPPFLVEKNTDVKIRTK